MKDTRDTFADMTLLQDISRKAPNSEPLIRIYRDQLSLNAAAARLLGLEEGSKVVFRENVGRPEGARKLFIGTRSYNAYTVAPVGKTYRIRSAELCRQIADMLDGCGTYRIEEENAVRDFNGDVYFSIFFRKYS